MAGKSGGGDCRRGRERQLRAKVVGGGNWREEGGMGKTGQECGGGVAAIGF